jgi:hypothetical protein
MNDSHQKQSADCYSDGEAQQLFNKLVKIALKSPPKPLKSMERKGVPAQSKKRRKRPNDAA